MNYTTYLFDFDYTLADSSRGIVTCFRNVLNRHGYTQPTDDDIKRTIGKTLEDSFSILSGVTDPLQLAEFKKEYVKEADTHMTVNTVLFLETKSVLIALKDSGARIGIISTKFRYQGITGPALSRRLSGHHHRRRRCKNSQALARRALACHQAATRH